MLNQRLLLLYFNLLVILKVTLTINICRYYYYFFFKKKCTYYYKNLESTPALFLRFFYKKITLYSLSPPHTRAKFEVIFNSKNAPIQTFKFLQFNQFYSKISILLLIFYFLKKKKNGGNMGMKFEIKLVKLQKFKSLAGALQKLKHKR